LTTRQFSVSLRGPFVLGSTGQGFPKRVARRTPCQAGARLGAFHRNAPVGGAA
jgi:hypothetical protein